jgi:hypothetical protein
MLRSFQPRHVVAIVVSLSAAYVLAPVAAGAAGQLVTLVDSVTDTPAKVDPSGKLNVGDGSGALTVDGAINVRNGPAGPLDVEGTVGVTDGAGPLSVDGAVTVSGDVGVAGEPVVRPKELPMSAYHDVTATSGGTTCEALTLPAGKRFVIEGIHLSSYGGNTTPGAWLRLLAKNGTSTSRIMQVRIPLSVVGTSTSTDRSGNVSIHTVVHGGGQFDVQLGDLHSPRICLKAQAGETVQGGGYIAGYELLP